MELVSLGIGYIIKVFARNAEVQSTVDDFVTDSVKWVKGWFSKGGQKGVIEKLESSPDSTEISKALSDSVESLFEIEQFKIEFEKWVEENKRLYPSMKNVLEDVEISVQGNINIGDKGSNEIYDKKNVIEKGKIEGGGDFNLGDIS